MKIFITSMLIVLVLAVSPTMAQQVSSFVVGARAARMGQTSLTLTDGFALFNNPGAMAKVDKAVGMTALKEQYNFAGFRSLAAGVVMPFKKAVFGLAFTRFGDNLYNEQLVSLAGAYTLAGVGLGVRLGYVQYHFGDLSTRGRPIFDFGANVQLTESVFLGAFVFNTTRSAFGNAQGLPTSYDVAIPTIIKLGVGWMASDKLVLQIETAKDIDFKPQYRAGLEYIPIKGVSVRTGFEAREQVATIGVGFDYKSFSIGYAGQNHPALGFTHQFSLAYSFAKKKE